ncbi:hypothetical protein FLK61_34030 [Paenalkalicoccus suaedae]|uniref:Uncharacterized protein n=1 Tax=Paenalkalicoccus suaedae TaxID=2592382 RepID=A0A859FFT7_9BACI|nr:hypothetical protein [Paenalkalicoccus suaedae]QKS71647.1 hypothetical protein FLK61_33730 [Paenalkalicoccus suaedae]QKS71700.1 hypothetical protein FLK61_34030 [Paenalkalicoccus suaedae]
MTDAERKVLQIIKHLHQQKDRKANYKELGLFTGKDKSDLIKVLKSLETIGEIEVDYEAQVASLPVEYRHEKRARWDSEFNELNKNM